MKFQASLIISFYNKIEWLKLLLAALERQTAQQFQVVIADDGSASEVVKELEKIIAVSPLSIKHIWHPDNGFMKTVMLNKAITESESDYLIFTDGDCIPHHRFVEDHLRLRKQNQVLAGRRVNMSEEISNILNEQNIRNGILEKTFFTKLFTDSISGKTRDVEKAIHIHSTPINEAFGSYKKGLLGCNFSVSKNDLLSINGFDERYRHPGVGEDTEINWRMKKKGMQVFTPKFCLIQFHLWHPRLSRANEPENLQLFNETVNNKYIATPYGINK